MYRQLKGDAELREAAYDILGIEGSDLPTQELWQSIFRQGGGQPCSSEEIDDFLEFMVAK